MTTKSAGCLIVGILLGTSAAAVGENKGVENLLLQGGNLGNVPFSHHMHQNALGDCKLCHNLFPQVSGSIDQLKTGGKLKKKAVMDQCQTCHKQRETKGEKTGPTKCAGCHR